MRDIMGIDHESLLSALAKHGSPIYIFFPETMKDNINKFNTAFKSRYKKFELFYAVKSNFIPHVIKCANKFGSGLEVVPGIETDIIEKLGLYNSNVILNGPAKSRRELMVAVTHGAKINIDSITELEILNSIGLDLCRTIKCGIRLNCKVDIPGWDRFGFNIDDGSANALIDYIGQNYSTIELSGVHVHIGTNNNDASLYNQISEKITHWIASLEKRGIFLDYIDFGGGFPTNTPLKSNSKNWQLSSLDDFASAIIDPIKNNLSYEPYLYLEPGRCIIDDAFSFITKVIAFKNTNKSEVIVDGSVTMFPSGIHREHQIEKLSIGTTSCRKDYTEIDLYGSSPIGYDCFAKGKKLENIELGDYLIFYSAGAYSLNFSTEFINYLPSIILYEDGKFSSIRERGTIDSLLSNYANL